MFHVPESLESLVSEPAREIPLAGEFDVLVCGAGTAGCPAAIAAARAGARVGLLEKFSYIGGVPIHALNPAWHDANYVRTGLLEDMILEAYRRRGWKTDPWANKAVVVDPDIQRQLLTEWIEAAGVRLHLHTWFCDARYDADGSILVFTESKSGRRAFRTKILIDASGDADMAVALGSDYTIGDPDDDGATQGMTVRFVAGNIDFERFIPFLINHPECRKESPEKLLDVLQRNRDDEPFHLHATLAELYHRHYPDDADLPVHAYFNGCSTARGTFNVNGTMVHNVLGTSSEDLTRAEVQCRRQIMRMMEFARGHVPGWENAYLCTMAPSVGVRETRCIIGDYRLTADDCRAGTQFPDAVTLDHCYFDMHSRKNYSGEGLGTMMGIPFRALLPRGLDNVAVVGRCMSADHWAQSSTRLMHVCFLVGNAIGILAAHAVRSGIRLRDIPHSGIRPLLLEHGMDPLAKHGDWTHKGRTEHKLPTTIPA